MVLNGMWGSVVLVSGPVWMGVMWDVTRMGACVCQVVLNTSRERMGGVNERIVHIWICWLRLCGAGTRTERTV